MAKFSDLYIAVRAKDIVAVKRLVDSGVDINIQDSMRRTVLHHVAEKMLYASVMITKLIEFGADINARDIQGKTPLHYVLSDVALGEIRYNISRIPILEAVFTDPSIPEETRIAFAEGILTDKIRNLVEVGADINAKFDDEVTSLHIAASLNNTHWIDSLVELGVDMNAKKLRNFTVFHKAVARELKSVVRCLVELGADVNASYTVMYSVHEAVEAGSFDTLKTLVEKGADVNVCRVDGVTSLASALASDQGEMIKYLLMLGADVNFYIKTSSLVIETVKLAREDMLELIVHHGAEVSPLTGSTMTPLGDAVYTERNCNIVEVLLKSRADINKCCTINISPLNIAVRSGDTKMVKSLVKLGADVNMGLLDMYPPLYLAICSTPKIAELLLENVGGINDLFDFDISPLHVAVACRDKRMVQVLAALDANMNRPKVEGMSLLDTILLEKESEHNLTMIKILVQAGLDINVGYNDPVTPLHDAVRKGDIEMVQLLVELGADVNCSMKENVKPLVSAAVRERLDVVSYFAGEGADMNVCYSLDVRPLHMAVRTGNCNMIKSLLKLGANIDCVRHSGLSALNSVILTGDGDMFKHLISCGADVNLKSRRDISVVHDAIEFSDKAFPNHSVNVKMIELLLGLGGREVPDSIEQVTLLGESIIHANNDATETLLRCGVDQNCQQNIRVSPMDYALKLKKSEVASLLYFSSHEGNFDRIGSLPLHTACQYGHIDQARLLIFQGSDSNRLDYYGNKPLEYLPLSNEVDYTVLNEFASSPHVVEETSVVSIYGCRGMLSALKTPGIGDVRCIAYPKPTEISERMMRLLQSVPDRCHLFHGGTIIGIGSAAEGTKVGLPNEMDFMYKLQMAEGVEEQIKNRGDGYVQYDYDSLCTRKPYPKDMIGLIMGSSGFHNQFREDIRDALTYLKIKKPDENLLLCLPSSPDIMSKNRKACSPLMMMWQNQDTKFIISVDVVPCFYIDGWPDGAINRTWLMDAEELRSRGYVLVPKPPHVDSDLAKEGKLTEYDLQTLWKISFPHIETEHMQKLEPRVKDVYLTAKCLRNPDVCRIWITDNGSLPRNVDKYITSYLLKMIFFKNVEYFLSSDLSLGEMVCRVFDELEEGLSAKFIPLFFLPKVSALSGIKLDVSKSAKVAGIMKRFVRALNERDYVNFGDDNEGHDQNQKRSEAVYHTYDIGSNMN